QHRQTIELGDLIIELLRLRKIKFKDDEQKFEEAAKDYDNYDKQVTAEKEKEQFDLTEEQKQELKKNFRKATIMCHPDKVSDEFKDEAEKVFIDLKKAYEANDLERVSEIMENLEDG